jgi:hypothetical protein
LNPRFVWRRLVRLANFGWRWLLWLVTLPFRVLLWIWLHPRKAFQAFLEIGAVSGIAYLVYDTYFQTEATISSVASDPKNPFYLPFSVANNSHIFPIRDVKWRCIIDYLVNDKNMAVMESAVAGSGEQAEILPNGILNIDCSGFYIAPPIMEARIFIELSYKTSVFGWHLPRKPPPTEFNWYGRFANPQWIKGKSLRGRPPGVPRLIYDPKTGQILVKP